MYRLAGQEIYFSCPVSELEPFEVTGAQRTLETFPGGTALSLTCQTIGWVGGEDRRVEVWSAPRGTILKVEDGADCFISAEGESIVCLDETMEPTQLDREVLSGPALVLALALHGTWCLHASAVMLRGQAIVFLGESGWGKSTLAAYLSEGKREWQRVADDILPVTIRSSRVEAWPHFPQLKLSAESQPGPHLPEQMSVHGFCVLTEAGEGRLPELQLFPRGQATRKLVSHTAGARLFAPSLLADHLAFCAETARCVPVYALTYERRRETLMEVCKLLETLC